MSTYPWGGGKNGPDLGREWSMEIRSDDETLTPAQPPFSTPTFAAMGNGPQAVGSIFPMFYYYYYGDQPDRFSARFYV